MSVHAFCNAIGSESDGLEGVRLELIEEEKEEDEEEEEEEQHQHKSGVQSECLL